MGLVGCWSNFYALFTGNGRFYQDFIPNADEICDFSHIDRFAYSFILKIAYLFIANYSRGLHGHTLGETYTCKSGKEVWTK